MSQLKAFEKMIKDQKGKILICMVHESVYGILKGLNYILVNPDAKLVEEYLMGGCEEICLKVWEETMMAARPMVVPMEAVKEFSSPPPEFTSIKSGEAHIRKILKKGKGDPFYFRKGEL